ncbi:zinc ABC transporter substrate-binding protein [Salipiger sp. P9]|uniref:zinc ABC transporter substrate-binding protein n=1 Tax=Salipiger pentaromativorans TaxID=2943193 RepID=UPI002158787A|nr:zinc ABC transporter substrate-binding protein [Salipiger pentaromativorans]MCR8549831.1 zinc ABC transporter substrate-binding protein [Salipiger pentaromativorans]
MLKPLLPAALLLATPLWAEAPRTVTDIGPVQGLVAAVMGDLGTPDVLVPKGASPHSHALTPSEARALQDAELVFWIGPDLTPGIGRKIEAIAGDAATVVLSEQPGTLHLASRDHVLFDERVPADEDDHDHDEADAADAHDDHDHAEDAGHEDHDDHDHAGGDPHLWLSPENAANWLPAIAGALAKADPVNAAAYRANAAAAQAALDDAVARAAARLAPVQEDRFVVFHDAYQYYERAFGLHVIGAIKLSDATDPSPARLDALRDAVAESGATCVFAEPQFDPRLIAAITEGAETKVAELDPLGLALAPGAGFYPALIEDLAERIATCAAH